MAISQRPLSGSAVSATTATLGSLATMTALNQAKLEESFAVLRRCDA